MIVHCPTPTPYAPSLGATRHWRVIPPRSPTHPVGAYGVGPVESGARAREGEVVA